MGMAFQFQKKENIWWNNKAPVAHLKYCFQRICYRYASSVPTCHKSNVSQISQKTHECNSVYFGCTISRCLLFISLLSVTKTLMLLRDIRFL